MSSPHHEKQDRCVVSQAPAVRDFSKEEKELGIGPTSIPLDRYVLEHIPSAVSGHDMPIAVPTLTQEDEDIYRRFTPGRKRLIVAVVAVCSFLAPISSTTVLSAVPEVAATYNTDGTMINLSNALYLIFMGLSPIFWGPIGTVYGRRRVSIVAVILFTAFSIGTALAPNLASFFVFRSLTAYQGTCFLVVGSSVIGDIYKPTERATAIGWFLSGTLIGPALGPFIGGAIVTFRSWRVIFWLQTALGGAATLLVIFFLPETIIKTRSHEFEGLSKVQYARGMWHRINPFRVVLLYRYPNLLITGLASSALLFSMYGLLTPIAYVINPRFDLTTPLQSGLFYIPPGAGYFVGSFFGGRWADYQVKKWVRIRGKRVPEDRLRSCIVAMGLVIPGCMLVYGWSIEKRKGGIPLPVICMFIQGVAQLFCFPSLNTYCLDVVQERSAEVVAANFMLRYFFAALGTATCLPSIQKIGVGWVSTICAAFLVLVTVLTHAVTIWGRRWHDQVDANIEARKQRTQRAREGLEGM
ncbi:MFS general substrate transporter [Eremomyces bilateralis CBS 781.70]|uniref:MFS general substrate transporter n=1 Tax=Eremomyces bilateralis CBS 781.70 TaxID=1392243 RepID=A0A6G1FYV7_9PEZI|nr:MFS general substrate transporter [Eremomyces bilateralis CBS 781.70]KAF1811055.1 MFS general substrate transporter [Eremomyces bilateralis CBS 781.70]